ncbi:phage tail fiber protein [Candidatus Solirubrobacter pratensis]|uniref:phage tail fiber protein n=1 Tax=Candidatus Solirubrobacter pratensis TaxID=1298857 RepID=UPI000483AEFA|nr:hypothetical protein [Candidatus Solirubrobacter pratensis]
MPISDFLKTALVNHVTGATTYTPPTTLYAGLFSSMPAANGGGTELTIATAGKYTRFALAWAGMGSPRSLSGNVYFPSLGTGSDTAPSPWPTVVAVGIFDALSSGHMLAWEPLTTPRRLNTGDFLQFTSFNVSFAIA